MHLVAVLFSHSNTNVACRTVKVWREGKLVSSIRLPDSVWSVAALDNGDIVTACADGVTRVFTQAEERGAPLEELQEYTALVANRTLQLKSALGGLQVCLCVSMRFGGRLMAVHREAPHHDA